MGQETPEHRSWWIHKALLPVVKGAVEEIIEQLPTDEEDRHGGYFCLCERERPEVPVIVVLIGDVPQSDKRVKYYSYAQEKAQRLARISLPYHVSSWLSRNPEAHQWGGGIRTDTHYLAFSGLPELADEAAMLLAARRLGMLTKEQAEVIASHSNNQIYLGTEWLVATH